ncbi:hypothetical protein CBR_g51472 [Chara braunii]|uniref:c-Myc-binding protein n=1 Tax=Chara braunii TaxID=69332 RepID=A0A388K6B2_CHABU|nr:hypothetical protein CBR_g51472 [Chara braunii]|eukprot:GBG65590.1 hypothetical protein CBR_g51472 [Chara braunii]
MEGDSKKEAFRKYLDTSGVLEALTKVLVTLYEEPEKPQNAIDFLKSNLGAPTPAEYDQLKNEKEQIETKCKEVEAQLAAAVQELQDLKTAIGLNQGPAPGADVQQEQSTGAQPPEQQPAAATASSK